MNEHSRNFLKGLAVWAAIMLVPAFVLLYRLLGFGTPGLYESHVCPGKPTVEIRWTQGGFMGGGSSFDAYLVQGWTRKKILTGLDNIASHFDNTSNAMPRTYVTRIAARDRPQIYQVAWSADSNRVAIAYHGYFVPAYDRLTGRRIEDEDYLDTRV